MKQIAFDQQVFQFADNAPALCLAYPISIGDMKKSPVFPVVHQHDQQLVFHADFARRPRLFSLKDAVWRNISSILSNVGRFTPTIR